MENRTVTGQTKTVTLRLSKSHQDYWRPRLRRRSYRGRDGIRVEIPEWQVRMFHLGREAWFNLQTSNASAAAVKARDIYVSLLALGWDATLSKFKPDPLERAEACRVGEFLKEVGKRSHIGPRTMKIYATKFRKLIADLGNVDSGVKGKARRAKHDYHHGGRKEWLAKVEGKSLAILSRDSITAWRNRYVAKAGTDPLKRKSAERSAASILRCTRALFAPDVLSLLRVKMPQSPFDGLKIKEPGPQRYVSDVSPEFLLGIATRDLLVEGTSAHERTNKRQQYLALFLCLWAGLRRKEADLLLWEQVDFEERHIHIRRTRYFEPKTEESQRMVDIAPEAMEVLRQFKEGSSSEFVLDGTDADPTALWPRYRCNATWRALLGWLRSKGVRQRNAVHVLRKESGSLIASTHGIEAARQHLGHRDIRTTSAHYVSKKRRIEVTLSRPSPLEDVG